ncbi:aldolase/citrate lyase family protein [Bacteroidota bacterium]
MSKTGTAGIFGGRIRSDCLVQVEITASGGISLDIQSKVNTLYGRSMRDLARRMLEHFKIQNAHIHIQDSGALEFVLAARIEAAIKQVTETGEEFLLPANLDVFPKSEPGRFRFTRLYIPGNSPSMMLNAGIHKPDGVILDLEDSVAPGVKEEARILVRNALRTIDFYGAERMVRINQLPMGLKDLESIIGQQPDLVLIPKVESPDDLIAVETRIMELSSETDRGVFIMPILESALGIERAFEIAIASKNIVAMAIGLEDYTADMGVQRTENGEESFYARSRMLNACRAAGIQAIDSVYSDVDNESGLRETVSRSRSMGFEGMGCIHPRQVPVIHEAFRPGADEIGKAMAVTLAFENAEKKGIGVVSLGSKMIDLPVVRRAQRTLALAQKMSLISKNWRKDHEKS